MSRNGAEGVAPAGVRELVVSLGCLPAVVTDRHLTVVTSNLLAQALTGAFRPGVNIARYAFLGPSGDDDDADEDEDEDEDRANTDRTNTDRTERDGTDAYRPDTAGRAAGAGRLNTIAQVAAMLRDSLEQHEEDDGFRRLVGELSSQSILFARTWAHDHRRPARTGEVRFAPASVGPLSMAFQELLIPDDFALRLLLWRPAGAPSSHRAFDRLRTTVTAGD